MKKQKKIRNSFLKNETMDKKYHSRCKVAIFFKKTFRRKEGNFRSIRKSEEIKIPGLR